MVLCRDVLRGDAAMRRDGGSCGLEAYRREPAALVHVVKS